MRWPFRRRRALGAAVTDLPSAPLHGAWRPAAATPPAVEEPAAVEVGPPPVAPPVVEQPVVEQPVVEQPVVAPPAPRVGLGFRDGTTAELDPSSEASRALEALAGELVRAG
jgi:hypothetical protein